MTEEKKLTGYPSIDKPWLKFYPQEAIQAVFPEMSMKQYLVDRCRENLELTALNYYGRKITYRELLMKIAATQYRFSKLGIVENDTVSIAAPFFPETIIAFYALNGLGAIINMVDPRVPADKLLQYIIGSNSKYIIAVDLCYEKIKQIKDKSPLKDVILVSPLTSLPAYKRFLAVSSGKKYIKRLPRHFMYWEKLSRDWPNVGAPVDAVYRKENPAVIIYTSGTSGEPKGAVASNDTFNNIACSQSFSLCETKAGDSFLLIMPPFIAYGLAIGMHGQLCRGQELIMIPTFNIDNQEQLLGNLVSKHKPQTIMGVPAFMVDLVKHPKMQKLDCSFLKTVIVGGDSMVPSAEADVNAFLSAHNSSARICKGWGLTEVNSAFSYTKEAACNPLGSVGIPLIGNNIKVVEPQHNDNIDFDSLSEMPYEHTGELYINSKSLIIDYLNNPVESSKIFFRSRKDGEIWVRTRDLGRVTTDGIIFIDGRMKRIIIRPDGHNISPFAIENIINVDERVQGCVVIGKQIEGQIHGAYAVAYIQLKPEFIGDEKEVLRSIQTVVEDNLPPRDVASEYIAVNELPLTSIGKVDYRAMEKMRH